MLRWRAFYDWRNNENAPRSKGNLRLQFERIEPSYCAFNDVKVLARDLNKSAHCNLLVDEQLKLDLMASVARYTAPDCTCCVTGAGISHPNQIARFVHTLAAGFTRLPPGGIGFA